ncbi:MAG TPA: tripartite tricarboxylate transporter substrate-binding protein [Xanthobacteraceae bacterium]|nr:tripartite tricarboxylate transporter substrate-binding protein [Xanthobacteraceae bacterium]
MAHFFTKPIFAATIVWLASCATALAQDYPARTIRVIIPLAAGGGGDIFTRAIADELQKAWGQSVVVENRPGGALNIGTRACAEAAPDGYTLCVLSSEPVIYNQFLFKNLPFDPDKDFEPISLLFFNTLALVVNSALNVKTIPDLVALSKAKPGTLSYGTFAFPLAYFMEKLKKETGADIVRVPFRGGGEVVNAVLSGSTPVAILALSNMISQLQSGSITGLAVNSKTRSPLFPDIPTLTEAYGSEQYPSTWFGLFAPAGTPRPIIAKLAREVARIIDDRDFRQRMFIDRAVEPSGMRLEELAGFIRDDRKRAERIVNESGLKAE